MDNIERLFRKISEAERKMLLDTLALLESSSTSLKINKLSNTDFYKIRKGRYRIIFHYSGKNVVVDSIKLRNESTYKNL